MASLHHDVIIVGGGVIGCGIAFELAEMGARVRLFESRGVASGASHASAGVLAPYVEGHSSPTLRQLGRRSLDMYETYVARVSDASGVPVEFRQCGTLEVAVTAADVERLQQTRQVLAAEHVEGTWLEADALQQSEPAVHGDALGAMQIPIHAAVDVQALAAALARAATARGAQVVAGARVTAITAHGDGVAVRTETGEEHAPQVVLAAGAWSSALAVAGAAPLPVRPFRGQLLLLATPPGTLRHVVWGSDVYLVPRADGTVLVGATSEDVGFDERSTAAGVAQLLAAAIALVPALADATFVEARQGLRPWSPDDLPFLGRSEVLPGLLYACGHYRNGALLAPLTAALVKQMVGGDSTDPALRVLSPSRTGRL